MERCSRKRGGLRRCTPVELRCQREAVLTQAPADEPLSSRSGEAEAASDGEPHAPVGGTPPALGKPIGLAARTMRGRLGARDQASWVWLPL
ncbi:hypothetical protein NDU88_004492 [Pleurodeles waltl]|uniref:Uncharacterized protein n=1 Tax=Pleurodeles waltl TaxID=8319 RepID=A0AAV7VIY5_PLEWA|nr:hypothetical protein NDU88_004492 [Pleurodeles waltl]